MTFLCKNRRTSNSGLVSLLRMRDMLKLRVCLECTSAIGQK
jgi:hypothetical protein